METTERLVCKREDGGVSIVVPAEGTTKERAELDAIKQGYKSFRWMPIDALPKDREFRDAWGDETPELKVDISLPKAKDIQLTRLREKRDELLNKYDKLGTQAADMDDIAKIVAIKAKKQQLRDATNALKSLNNPKSIDEIKAATPSLEGF